MHLKLNARYTQQGAPTAWFFYILQIFVLVLS